MCVQEFAAAGQAEGHAGVPLRRLFLRSGTFSMNAYGAARCLCFLSTITFVVRRAPPGLTSVTR